MNLFVVGLNHKTAPVELRERLALGPEEHPRFLNRLRGSESPLSEGVFLSTCNRVELYGVSRDAAAEGWMSDMLSKLYGSTGIASHLYRHQNERAVQHLFEVASGLDSLVLGEHEILGQVKNAYLAAQTQGLTGKLTNVLFQRALYVGKYVRTHTGLGAGSLSVASVAVDLAYHIFGKLSETNVLIVGAGEMAELAGRHLLSQKVHALSVTNRTHAHAQSLAEKLGGRAFPLEELYSRIEQADIVICSTGSPEPLIRKHQTAEIMKQRKGRSLFFIDIAVPRDVEPGVHELDNVYLYNIDDLKGIVAKNLTERSQEIEKAREIAKTRVSEFMAWLSSDLSGERAALRHGPPQG